MTILRRPLLGLLLLAAPAAAAVVDGTVVDRSSQQPVAGARVSVQASRVWVETDAAGAFELDVPETAGDADGWAVIVAAKKGYYNASTTIRPPSSALELRMDTVARMDNPDYVHLTPSECGECHPDQLAQWTGSPMARTGVNRWVYDIYDGSGTPGGAGGFVYTRDSDYADVNPHSECAACHQPEGWIAEPHTPLAPLALSTTAAEHGISCDVCHKIADIDESKKSFPGVYEGVVTISRPYREGHQVQYGVLGDATYSLYPSRMRPSYQPQLVAAACGACHQDRNDPDQDGEFEEENGIIAEPTYVDWLNSPYGDPASPHYTTCVDCHMPPSGETTACEFQEFVPPERDPTSLRSHRIEGTTPQYLENAVTMSIEGEIVGDELGVVVTIENDQTGHHVPGGVPIRNLVLLVEAFGPQGEPLADTGGQRVHDLAGQGDPAQGYFAGLPGKLYAIANHTAGGHFSEFFTEATGEIFDTRIPAWGRDQTQYRFVLPGPEEKDVRVRARLIYRRAFRHLVDAKGWTEDGHGRPLVDLQPPHFGHLMEEAEWTPTLAARHAHAPSRSRLYQSYPNPVNATATVGFDVLEPMQVRLTVYDLLGQEVAVLTDEFREIGYHTVIWDGRSAGGERVSTGVYLTRLQAGGEVHSQRLLLLR